MAKQDAGKYTPRMKATYDATIAQAMTEKFGYKNAMEIPRIEKITINIDRKSTRLNSSHIQKSRMPSSA